MTGLKSEIAQELPFSSDEEEALLNLMRTLGLRAAGVSAQDARLGRRIDTVQRGCGFSEEPGPRG